MSWSYTITLPTDKDKVRSLVGDTDATDPLVSDEEIQSYLTTQGNLYLAAAQVAYAIAAKFARKVAQSVAGSSISANEKAQAYTAVGDRLLSLGGGGSGVAVGGVTVAAWAGGLSVSDKAARAADTNRVQPAFVRNQFQIPGTEES